MRRIETLIVLLALGFYAWFLHRFGWTDVLHYVRVAGWGLVLTVALEAVARLTNTLGWRVTIDNCPKTLGFGELFAARIAGEAVDYVTPSAQLGGQFVMAMMVRHKLAMAAGLVTVVVAALAEMLGQVGFITGGMLTVLPFEARFHHLLGPALGGLGLAIALAAGFFYVQIKRPFSHLWRAAVRLDLSRIANDEMREAAAEADTRLLEFYARHSGRLAVSCLCYLVAWSLGPVEIYILLTLLGEPVSWQIAVLVEVFGQLIERATFMIPAKLVSQEGGKALVMAMLGYPADVGFAVGLLRRFKEMVWVCFGLISLTVHRLVVERADRETAGSPRVLEISSAPGEQSL
jgi:glycosyltransferase 2 family protein